MRNRRHKLQVSTFPFLAVLLCAMGALLLVLLVMDRRAHDAARQRAAQAARRAPEEIARGAEKIADEAAARRAAVEQARQDALATRDKERDAEHARLERREAEVQGQLLSIKEQMARAAERLRAEQDDEAALKQKVAAEQSRAASEEQALVRVRAEEKANAVQSESARQALARMTADLAQLEHTLADLKAAREKEKQTYSVIPYNGKRGENRRPLYIECAADEVIFHPDRMALSEARLAAEAQPEIERRAALLKERLPLARAAAFTPYLMLLVRPDGVASYYRLRDALHGLKIDFGYEVVDKDWVLDVPGDDQDAPTRPETTAAKSSPSTPAAEPHHMIGLAPAREQGATPGGPNPGGSLTGPDLGGGPSGPPGLFPPLNPSGMGNSVGQGGSPGGPGGVPDGPRKEINGIASGSPPQPVDGPPLLGPDDPPPGPLVGATPGPPRPATPGGAPPAPPGVANGAGATPGSQGLTGPTIAHSSAGGPPPAPGTGPGGAPAAPGTRTAEAAPGGKSNGPGTSGAAAGPRGNTAPPASDAVGKSGPKDAAKPGTAAPHGAASGSGAEGQAAAGGEPNEDPFLRGQPTPPLPTSAKTKRPPPVLRPARLSGDRDWILYVECKEEGVVVYPTQLLVPASALARPSGSNPLLPTVQQLIDHKQATVRAGEIPYRPEVRFLVHPDAERTYHLAYPMLDTLAAPKTAQSLGPDDDVQAIVAGH